MTYFFLLPLILFVVYFPVFSTHYVLSEDAMMGVSLKASFVGHVVAFLFFLGVVLGLKGLMSKITRIPNMWIVFNVLAFAFLPGMTLCVTRLHTGISESLAIGFLLGAYGLWHFSRQGLLDLNRQAVGVALSAFLSFVVAASLSMELASLFFVFTLVMLLYSSVQESRQVGKWLLSDMVFWGIGVLAAWGLRMALKYPIAFNVSLERVNISVFIKTALAGPWHLLLGEQGMWFWILGFVVCCDIIFLENKTRAHQDWPSALVRLAWVVGVVIIIGTWTTVSNEGVGYLKVLPLSMACLVIFFRSAYAALQPVSPKLVVVILTGGVILAGGMTHMGLANIVENYQHENQYIQTQVSPCLAVNTKNFYMIPLAQEESLSRRPVYFEYARMLQDEKAIAKFVPGLTSVQLASRTQWLYPDRPENCIIDFRKSPYWRIYRK